MGQKNRYRIAALLCALALIFCLAALTVYLIWAGMRDTPTETESDTFGMVLIDIPDDEAAAFYHVDHLGVYVLAVDEESRAYRLGVRSGDRLFSVNGCTVTSAAEFALIQEEADTGEQLVILFYRGPANEPVHAAFVHKSLQE